MSRLAMVAAAVVVLSATSGCGADDEPGAGPIDVEVLVTGLDGPTQLTIGPDGSWYVAQLTRGENDGDGQVLRIDPDDVGGEPTVVLDGLDKPTGVAVFAGELWVMERRRLTRGPLDGTQRTVVVDEMAYNGRSEGALTVDGDRLLFDTSGTGLPPTGPAGDPVATSGALWSVDAAGDISQVAFGFKHAYVQATTADGTLWTTEMSDGLYDGTPAADEVIAVAAGADHGWPACVGDNRPVAEREATDATCASVPRSQAVFAPGATPTGLAIAPWDPGQLVVALWVEGRVVSISSDPSDAPAIATVLTEDVARPQHLVTDGDRLLLTDHERGQIVALTAR